MAIAGLDELVERLSGVKDAAVDTDNDLFARFADAPESALRAKVAPAMQRKATNLTCLDRPGEEVYDELLQRFGETSAPASKNTDDQVLRRCVARALGS